MTRILLDTHAFMWWIDEPARVRLSWVEQVVDPGNEVFVSSISALEIESKKRLGKLRFDHVVADVAAEFEFRELAISMDHGSLAGALDWAHRDPFDRLLVAQALLGEMVLLTADDAMKSAPGVRVL